jgi:HK97 family phage prohead protease
MDDYETAARRRDEEDKRRGYSISSDGGWVESINGRTAFAAPRPTIQKRRTNTGKVLQGYACKLDTIIRQGDNYKYIHGGAFDDFMKSGTTVRMLMEHNDALEFGDSKSNLILHTDDYGVAFRCHLRDDEISNHACDLAESKAYTECSIGLLYYPKDAETRIVSKTSVTFIHRAEFNEVSLVKTGACPQTHAVIENETNCRALFQDCNDKKLMRDNSFEHLQRTLRKLID